MSRCGTCPDHNQLVRFVRGQLPAPEITNVERHVEACAHCGDTLADIQLEVTGVMHAIASDYDPAESQDRRLVSKKARLSAKWVGSAAIMAGLVAVAAILNIVTGKGTLILEVNEPDVNVSVDGARIEIRSLRDTIDVSVGDHELEVSKDGFTAFTKRFSVKRGGKTELAARLEPLPAAKNASPPAQELAELTVEVPATRQWTATGLTLRENMELQIAASGKVDAAPETDTRQYYQLVPPTGRQERIEHFPEPKVPGLCLLGRIGKGPTFYVGDKLSFIVKPTDSSGELYLGINDDLVDDNFGAWQVKIRSRDVSSK